MYKQYTAEVVYSYCNAQTFRAERLFQVPVFIPSPKTRGYATMHIGLVIVENTAPIISLTETLTLLMLLILQKLYIKRITLLYVWEVITISFNDIICAVFEASAANIYYFVISCSPVLYLLFCNFMFPSWLCRLALEKNKTLSAQMLCSKV